MTTSTAGQLRADDLNAAKEIGYFVARGLMAPAEVDEIKQSFMALNANGPVEGISEVTHHTTKEQYAANDPLRFYPRMMHPHRHPEFPVGPVAMKYMLDSRLYPILKELIEDEPVAVQSMFYFKPPGARGQALHQDNFYLRVAPGTCMAAWLAIDDADAENGGMVVVPGSSGMKIVCPERADRTKFFTSDNVPIPAGLKEVPTELKAGDVLFFNGSLIHGSYPNTSKDRFRRSLIFHYVPKRSTELSSWYRDPTTFEGEVIQFPGAVGGGPCGALQAAISAPH
jgi:ectoine hydroxylase-related dioxygenase (phytanoyl-CoA dioxygenase family)